MSDHHDVQASVRKYLIVGFVLFIGTILTVWSSYINFGSHAINIAVGLCIASFKGFCVAAFFMHLIDERKMIYLVLSFAAFFFAGMMLLTVWAKGDIPMISLK